MADPASALRSAGISRRRASIRSRTSLLAPAVSVALSMAEESRQGRRGFYPDRRCAGENRIKNG
ncbi:hypothetical protein GCM10022205_05010 [Spinactinospora alkalitolerans]